MVFPNSELLYGNNAIGGAIGGAKNDLTERQIEVLNMIINDNKLSNRSIAKSLGINSSAVLKHLDVLKEKGYIERIGSTRGYWKVFLKNK